MGAGHSHSHRAPRHSAAAFEVGRRPRAALLSGLLLAAVVTLVAMVLLWPDQDRAEEVVRTLATSIGLVLSVPLTTAIAALTVPGPRGVAD
ncbi:hypothetical protein [Nocardioides ferulae]|uniref:hypothetical protein n=1 Tax=Nocardioides ferulae TaxID=2340821 RepID=UPI000EAD2D12|nr:hypothetical protein [Nocardioides ferulae]